jgi:hypothetical protein
MDYSKQISVISKLDDAALCLLSDEMKQLHIACKSEIWRRIKKRYPGLNNMDIDSLTPMARTVLLTSKVEMIKEE